MEPENLSKCNNCGAPMVAATTKNLKCPYCGSDYYTSAGERGNDSPSPDQRLPLMMAKPQNNNGGCAVAIAVAVLLFIGGLLIANNSGGEKINYTDSVNVDTATHKSDSIESPKREDSPYKSTLVALSSIAIDPPIFKKLYRNAYRKPDKFSGNKEIYDRSSPQYVNLNGFYTYIIKNNAGIELRFATQYVAGEWLFINEMIINADGENSTLTPDFKRDSGDGSIWEWCDMDVPDENIPMLIKIATAKKVSVKYYGDKYYKIVKISAKQQLAIKRELQLYKGLLLGYKTN